MSNTLSRKQIQQMRRLSNARFPMLGVVIVAALFVVRVPIIQSWETRADARNLQRLRLASKTTTPDDTETTNQVATAADAASEAEPDATQVDVEDNGEPV